MAEPTAELSEGAYEMLRAAVNLARERQLKSAKSLRSRLVAAYPGREADVSEAIRYWASSIRQRYPEGVPRFGGD